MTWDGREPIPGLGPVGGSKDQPLGFLLHTTLAVRWPQAKDLPSAVCRPVVPLLGIADQQYYVRQPRPAGETRQARLSRARESELWEQATYRLGEPEASELVRWVRVTDRGSDSSEYLLSCAECGQVSVVRATQDRALLDDQGEPIGNLFARVRAQAPRGEIEVELRGRAGQPKRRAQLQISAVEVCLRAPYRPGHGRGTRPPIRCTAVRVWEERAPTGQEPLEWILWCDGVRTSFELGRECAQQYATRWLCEEFHQALKTGLKTEEWQLKRGAQLMAATAVKSVVALRLLDVREHARQEPEAEASQSGLNEVELEVLEVTTGRKLETVREVVLALGRLGGHLNRKRDGLPGWITLWRGWLQLQALVEGLLLAHKLKKFG